MKNGVTTICDACFKPLDGIVGTAKVKKQYLSIRGIMSLKVYDKHKVEHYVYGEPAAEIAMQTWYNFCNGACLDAFMKAKITMKALYHDAKGLSPVEYIDPDTHEPLQLRRDDTPKAVEVAPEPQPEPPKKFQLPGVKIKDGKIVEEDTPEDPSKHIGVFDSFKY